MHTIALATQKGGSGKSTLAIGLALAAIQAGHTVRLIEAETSATLSKWSRRRPACRAAGRTRHRRRRHRTAAADLRTERRDADHHRHRRRRQRDDDVSGALRRSGADSRAPKPCRYRGDGADAELWFAPGASHLPSCSTRRRSAAGASAMPPQRSATTRRATCPTCWRSPASSCATTIRMRWEPGSRSAEYAPTSKSADEIGQLWHWVESKLATGAIRNNVVSLHAVTEYPARALPAHGDRREPRSPADPRRHADPGSPRTCAGEPAHFWHFGHQNVERPFCTKRLTMPLHPAVWHGSPSRS